MGRAADPPPHQPAAAPAPSPPATAPADIPPAASPSAFPPVDSAGPSQPTGPPEVPNVEAPSRALTGIELGGDIIDDKPRLLRFLGLQPGLMFDQAALVRLTDDLGKQLGYRIRKLEVDAGGVLHLDLEPVKVVRRVIIHGNVPFHYDDEISSHLKIRSGTELPIDAQLQTFLDEEAEQLRRFLERDGFFGSKVHLDAHEVSGHPDWKDVEVRIQRGTWYHIGVARPTGNHAVTAGELYDHFDHCCLWRGRFAPLRLREDARAAEEQLRQRGYPAARVTPDFDFARDYDRVNNRIDLPLKVVERRKVDILFIGNRSFSDKELRDQLTIFTNGAYDDIELAESARSIQRAYQQRGFFEAQVNYQRRRGGDAVEQVTFSIVEGRELKVRGVEVMATPPRTLSFTSEELVERAGLETKIFPRLGAIGLGQGGYATTVQLQQDQTRLIEFYHDHGFPMATAKVEVARDYSAFGALGAIGAEAAGSMADRQDLYVRFYVDEGRSETVQHIEVTFVGAHDKNEADIVKAMRSTNDKPVSQAHLLADRQRILALYRGTPHAYVDVKFDATWNAAHDRAVLKITIDEGPKVVFGEILIRGNFRTRNRTILLDLPWKAGQPYDAQKVEDGERNLQHHQLFTAVHVTPLVDDKKRNPLPVVVRIEERYLNRVRVDVVPIGISTDLLPNYVYTSLALIFPNVLGFGSQLELRGDVGPSTDAATVPWGFRIRYTDVHVFGPKWTFDAFGFWRREVTYRFGVVDSIGASLGLTYNLTQTLRTFLRYDNYQANIPVAIYRTTGPRDLSSITDGSHIAKFTLGLVWDKRTGADGRPNPLMADRGWLLQGAVGYAFPSWIDNGFVNFFSSDRGTHFVTTAVQAIGIAPFTIGRGRFSLIANLRLDYGFPIGQPALPLVERFFGGGDTATRGYDTDFLKSEVIPTTVSPLGGVGLRVIPQGGNMRLLSTVEVQFPIAKSFLGIGQWAGAIFWDMGAIANGFEVLSGSDFRHSIGVSFLRILTAVGPLSLEYAYPLVQTEAEERWKTNPWYSHWPGRIHFNWGIPLSRF